MGYQIAKPRTKVKFVEGPRHGRPRRRPASPVYPPGLPFCRRDALVYETGVMTCERCDDELAVVCPMCGLGRMAAIDTCANCGLVLKVKNRPVPVRDDVRPASPAARRSPERNRTPGRASTRRRCTMAELSSALFPHRRACSSRSGSRRTSGTR